MIESSVSNGNPCHCEFGELQGPEVVHELQITPVTKPMYIFHHRGAAYVTSLRYAWTNSENAHVCTCCGYLEANRCWETICWPRGLFVRSLNSLALVWKEDFGVSKRGIFLIYCLHASSRILSAFKQTMPVSFQTLHVTIFPFYSKLYNLLKSVFK
jgi:hypothetical protein